MKFMKNEITRPIKSALTFEEIFIEWLKHWNNHVFEINKY